MTTNQNPTVESVLSAHGFASIDDAREGNVFFGCLVCGSVKVCSPAPGRTREQEREILIDLFDGMDECCDGPAFML